MVRPDWRLGWSCRAGRRGVLFARTDVRCRLPCKNGSAAQSRNQPRHADIRACGKEQSRFSSGSLAMFVAILRTSSGVLSNEGYC